MDFLFAPNTAFHTLSSPFGLDPRRKDVYVCVRVSSFGVICRLLRHGSAVAEKQTHTAERHGASGTLRRCSTHSLWKWSYSLDWAGTLCGNEASTADE